MCKPFIQFTWLIVAFALVACQDHHSYTIEQKLPEAQQRVEQLRQTLRQGTLRNAQTLQQYSKSLIAQKPELKEVSILMEQEATEMGRLFRGLLKRWNDVQSPQIFDDNIQRLEELESLIEGLDVQVFNDALSDPINVLADLSDGQLPRVNAFSRELLSNTAQLSSPGAEQLVGNPNFGQWHSSVDGTSLIWTWFAASAMAEIAEEVVEYALWSKRRGYSYYHDYGRGHFSSKKQIKTQQTVHHKAQKSFQKKGIPFQSPYKKTRVGGSGLSRQSQKAQVVSKRLAANSSYARTSSTKKAAPSRGFRSSRSTTSRSAFGGK